MTAPPCRDCEERHPICHDSCERYQVWHLERLEQLRRYQQEREKRAWTVRQEKQLRGKHKRQKAGRE